MRELDRWDYNKREVMYNDSPDLNRSGWKPADPVVTFSTIRSLIQERDDFLEALSLCVTAMKTGMVDLNPHDEYVLERATELVNKHKGE